jgi:starch synthase
MKVNFIAAECAPVAKVGGLADVVSSLPKKLREIGVDASIILPFYEIISRKDKNLELFKKDVSVKFEKKEKKFDLYKTLLPNSNVPFYLIDNKEYFSGEGVYTSEDASSEGTKKEAKRFFFLSVAGIKVAQILNADIIHFHDWHTSTIPYLLKKKDEKTKNLLTIHNIGYQGIYPKKIVNELLEINFNQEVNSLKVGIRNADLINTVSPTYAKEILTPEYGFGLEKELKKRKNDLFGIINGIDTEYWNPRTDPYIKFKYSKNNLEKRKGNKYFLQEKFFKEKDGNIPLVGMVSRIAEQKGFDLIKKIFKSLMKENVQLIILGKGVKKYEDFLQEMTNKYPGKFGLETTFNEELAHQIYAGSDMFLMPSFFEPCGLGQLIAMRYGSIPIARETGGLKDTVIHLETGFTFKDYKAESFLKSIKESLEKYKEKDLWGKIQKNGLEKDFSWENSAKDYLKVYKKLIE